MDVKEFSNYDKACEFRDKVGGQVQWSAHKGKQLWHVWYPKKRNVKFTDNKKQEKYLLKRISDLCYQASEEIYDDDKVNGTGGILNLCDQLYEKIDKYLEE